MPTGAPLFYKESSAASNSQARVEIWQSFGAAVAAEPWLGAGFGTSARMGDLPVAEEVAQQPSRDPGAQEAV